MTLRTRLAVLTAGAVALAIVLASVVVWTLIRQSLLAEVDRQLLDRVPSADMIAASASDRTLQGSGAFGDMRVVFSTNPLGVQVIDPYGNVAARVPPGDIDIDIDSGELLLLGGSDGTSLRTVSLDGASYRVLATSVANGGVLRMIQPLAGVESTMTRIAWLLAAVSVAGMAVAGALGWGTARTALQPVGRLVTAAERVATTKDLTPRLEIEDGRRDEVTRLATTFNDMLDALEGARAQQRELVENASHELRTPLTTVRNDVTLLLRSEQSSERSLASEDRIALLANLEAETASLTQLVAVIVDLARGHSRPEPLAQDDLLTLAERAAARARRVDPEVTVTVTGSTVNATVRPAALERAIGNLIRNAVQVSDPGETVEVVVSKGGDWASIEVLDRGPGIEPHDMPRIFDRFYRGTSARTRHGSGLGLAIVNQVAEQHSGTITARNRPDAGAAFTLRVPVDPSD